MQDRGADYSRSGERVKAKSELLARDSRFVRWQIFAKGNSSFYQSYNVLFSVDARR